MWARIGGVYPTTMSTRPDFHHGWKFSSRIKGKMDELVEVIRRQDRDSDTSRQWSYVRNFGIQLPACNSPDSVDILSRECFSRDIDDIVESTVELFETGSQLRSNAFDKFPNSYLTDVFVKVQSRLSESGFVNFCKILGYLNDEKLVNISFDCVLLTELQQNEELPLPKINSLVDLARKKPRELCDCIVKLIRNENENFNDEHLLESVCNVVSDKERMDLVKAFTKKENLKESDWNLLKVLSIKATPDALREIILFMNLKHEQFASSQTFARLLINICKNSQSQNCKDLLLSIIEKNETLLKRQALKHLSSN